MGLGGNGVGWSGILRTLPSGEGQSHVLQAHAIWVSIPVPTVMGWTISPKWWRAGPALLLQDQVLHSQWGVRQTQHSPWDSTCMVPIILWGNTSSANPDVAGTWTQTWPSATAWAHLSPLSMHHHRQPRTVWPQAGARPSDTNKVSGGCLDFGYPNRSWW